MVLSLNNLRTLTAKFRDSQGFTGIGNIATKTDSK